MMELVLAGGVVVGKRIRVGRGDTRTGADERICRGGDCVDVEAGGGIWFESIDA